MFTNLLIHSATVERPTITADAAGATVRTWASVYTSLSCRIAPLSAEDADIARRHGFKSTHYFFYDPSDATVAFQDRVIISNTTYDVDSFQVFPDGTGDRVGQAFVTWKR